MQLTILQQATIIIAFVLFIAGCAAQLTHDGKNTVVGNPEKIKSCRLLGNTKISIPKSTSAFINEQEILETLQIEARNFAGRIGADTVVPSGKLEDNKQLFKLYNCNMKDKTEI